MRAGGSYFFYLEIYWDASPS
jgi:hypothetical protein